MPPNVILIHTDQQRYDGLGCTGNDYVDTPNIDRLAAEGTMSRRHIVSNSACMPSRASLLTGLYPPAHGVWINGIPLPRKELTEWTRSGPGGTEENVVMERATMADLFADAGYRTGGFGKFHLTPMQPPPGSNCPESVRDFEEAGRTDWHGPYYGFEHVDFALGHSEIPEGHYKAWLENEHPELYEEVRNAPTWDDRPLPGEIEDCYESIIPPELFSTNWIASRCNNWIRQRAGQDDPFFAFVGFPDPHHPFVSSREIYDQYRGQPVQTPVDPDGEAVQGTPLQDAGTDISHLSPDERAYPIRHTYAMIAHIDRAVGKILDQLEELGLREDTIIAFTSDHGDFLGDHGKLRKAYAGSDSLLHVPFILSGPGVERGQDLDEVMSNVDVLPTIAGLTDVELPENIHGRNVLAATNDDAVAYAYNCSQDRRSINYTLYDDCFRFTWYPQLGYQELYDHRSDPGECHNLADAPDRTEEVQRYRDQIAHALVEHNSPGTGALCTW